VKIHFPIDGVCSQYLSNTGQTITCLNSEVPEGWEIYDIGPNSVAQFEQVLDRADLIFWNGPVGVFELENFQNGSVDLLKHVVKRTREGALSIIGGGDTGNLVKGAGLGPDITYISTGGGASLEYIQGIKLPGIEALSEINDL
jgi:phosphoglycerate kinase